MAKKVAKKEASAAKGKKAIPKAKASAKPVKESPKKPSKAVVAKEAVVKEKAKPTKKEKAEKGVKQTPLQKKAASAPVDSKPEPKETKKEKKVKVDKTGLSEDQVKWHELHDKYKLVKPTPYLISGQFEAKTPIQHKTFGWGFVLSNEYDRLEVLFEDGKRMLISNRKL